jgi:hypothetical protein
MIFKVENASTTTNDYSQMLLQAGTATNYIWTQNQNSTNYGGAYSLNIYTQQAGPIAFFTNGNNERMRILANGKVGIGTIAPSETLQVNGNIRVAGVGNAIGFDTTGANLSNGIKTINGYETVIYNGRGSAGFGVFGNSNIRLGFGTSYTASQASLFITSTGNIGIGTTSPSYRLQIGVAGGLADSIRIGSYAVAKNTRQYIGYTRADSGLFETTGDGDTPSTVLAGVSGIRIVNTTGTLSSGAADNSVQLLTHIYNGGSRVALHANYNGNVGVGTTSPLAKLQVGTEQNSNATGISLAAGASVGNLIARTTTHHNWFPYTDGSNYYSADNHIFRNADHSTEWMRIASNGAIGIGGANYGSSGQVLTSNGSAAPSWQAVSAGVWATKSITLSQAPTTAYTLCSTVNASTISAGMTGLIKITIFNANNLEVKYFNVYEYNGTSGGNGSIWLIGNALNTPHAEAPNNDFEIQYTGNTTNTITFKAVDTTSTASYYNDSNSNTVYWNAHMLIEAFPASMWSL